MDTEEIKESTTDDLLEKESEENDKEEDVPEFGPIKRPSNLDLGQPSSIRQPLNNKSNKKTIILTAILLIVFIGGGYFILKSRGSLQKLTPTPLPAGGSTSTLTPTPSPTETPKPALNKSDWSLEVLNGSGQTGLAKKIGDQIKALGYAVVKTGNADNQNYTKTQIFVRGSLIDKVEMVIADLKDVIKIASFGGELKEGTASARIIIGKDSI